MNNQQINPFDNVKLDPTDEKQIYNNNPNKNPFDTLEVDESWGKSLVRYMMQVPSGIAQKFTWPADVLKMMGEADIYDDEEIIRLRNIAEQGGQDPDEFERKYYESAEKASEMFPTQHRIEQLIEEETGIPLEAKTRGQKALRFASTAGALSPKQGYTLRPLPTSMGSLPRPVLGAGIAATKETAQELGVPEPLAELGSFLALKKVPPGTRQLSGIGIQRKESGMPVRRFENIKAPYEVSAKTHKKIGRKIESDFKEILNDIVESSPIGETTKEIANNPKYKQQISDKFDKVSDIAINIPGSFSSNEIKNGIIQKIKSSNVKGISPSEYEETYKKFMTQFAVKIKPKELFAENLVDQFRKNNRTLGEIFESGKSSAYNRAKKEAYIDYNKTIAEEIKRRYPETEFSKLFEESNSQWSKIKDAEFVESFMEEMFDGKIDFRKGEKAFNYKESQAFKKALGKENFERFETLMGDLLSTKSAYKNLDIAKDQGFIDLAKIGFKYLVNPVFAIPKIGKTIVKSAYEMVLDKPKFAFTWKEGVDAFKKGDFAKAEAKFTILDKEVKQAAAKEGETISVKGQKVEQPKPIAEKPLELTYKEPNLRDIKSLEQKAKEAPKQPNADIEALGQASKKKSSDLVIPKEKISPAPIEAFHGTQREFKEFTTQNELGVHFSVDKETAKIFAEGGDKQGSPGRIIKADLNISNPLEMPDLAGWNSLRVAEWIDNQGLTKFKKSKGELGELESKVYEAYNKNSNDILKGDAEGQNIVRNFLKKNGYDSIKYTNKFEGKPVDSYIVLDPKQIKQLKQTPLQEFETLGDEILQLRKEKGSKKRIDEIMERREALLEHPEVVDELLKKANKNIVERENDKVLNPKKKAEAKKPISKVSEVNTKLDKIERQDISTKGLKSQKDFLMDALKSAIAKPSKAEKINIKVPGDGEFNFINKQDVLEKVMKKIDKDWPKQAVKAKDYPKHRLR